MKKFILALLVLASLVSCGKNNKIGNPTAINASPITVNDVNGKSLGSLIDSYTTSFGRYQYNAYETVNQVIARSPNALTYNYSNQSGLTYSFCFLNCHSNISVTRSVNNAEVNVTTKQNELKAIINTAHPQYPVTMISATAYQITTTAGDIYVIDTLYPLQANPVFSQKYGGKAERLVNVQ